VFVGHYSVSFAGKRWQPTVPLWVLFLAVQLLDVFWGLFVLLGIENVRIVPGITKSNPLDLYYMPYTHSLPAAFAWAILATLAYRTWRGSSSVLAALVVGAAVLSHWFLDLIMHRPDLPLLGNRFKVGFGLWNDPPLALVLELIVLLAGVVAYDRSRAARGVRTRARIWVFAAVLMGVQTAVMFGPLPDSAAGVALTALASYLALALVARWIEAGRTA
jgi:hypothetical protein